MNARMCRFAVSGLLATGLTFSTAAVFAQQANPSGAPDASTQQPMNGTGGMGHHRMDPDQQLAHMSKRYHLTPDQQTQIKPILDSQQQQMMSLRQDTSTSREDKMAKMKAIHEDAGTKIQAILNDSQKQKFNADQQKMQERRQERMQGHDAAAAGVPPTQ